MMILLQCIHNILSSADNSLLSNNQSCLRLYYILYSQVLAAANETKQFSLSNLATNKRKHGNRRQLFKSGVF